MCAICSTFEKTITRTIFGVSLSKPHIDRDNVPVHGMIVCQYLCIIYPVFVAPWFLRTVYTLWNALCILVYWHAHVHDLQLDWTAMTILCHENYWWRQAKVQTHGKNGFILLRHWKWSCSCLATCQHACVTQNWNNRWAAGLYYCFVTLI